MNESAPDDPTLLLRWSRDHCEQSFRLLVERYAGLVHHAAKRRSGDETIAAEASQATFILLARKAATLTARTSLAGWLHVTAVHQSRNLQRRQMRELRKRKGLSDQPDTTGSEAWSHMQPELDQAMAALSTPDREALLLRYYRALSVKEIAGLLGLTVEAAQKRLTRATDRLRLRLSTRGCTLTATAIAAGLAGLAGDAKAGVALAPALGTKAIAAAAATTPLTTLTGLILMTKKTALIATAAVLLVGAGTYAVIHQSSSKQNDTVASLATGKGKSTAADTKADGTSTAARPNRERPPAAIWPDLAQKYGESRTNLSRHVVDGFLGLLDEVLVLGESADDLGALAGKAPGDGNLGDLPEKLNLTAEQKAAASKLVSDSEKRRLEELRKLSAELRKEPRPLVELTLAADAAARKQITQEEYQAKAKETDAALKASIGSSIPNLQMGGDSGHDLLMSDPVARTGFEQLLDPTQAASFKDMVAAQPAEEAQESDLTETFKPMELEKLDQTLTSTKAMMEGVKKMIEGAKSLPQEVK
ncbi:MAG: sigma-70 family RNA polymerase sigma factor [Luteolibacter sp.]